MKFDVIYYSSTQHVLASETKEFESASDAEAFAMTLLTNERYYTIRSGAKMHVIHLALVSKIELIDRAKQEENLVLDIL